MDEKKNKFFLLIGLKQIRFSAFNEINEILIDKKFLTNDYTLQENFLSLENFLDQNILNLEKTLNCYINEIDLIIDYDDFLTVDVSTIHKYNNNFGQSNNDPNFLVNIKDNVIKDKTNYDLTHMLINKYIINGEEYLSIPSKNNDSNILLEIRFILFKSIVLKRLKILLSKYEILIKNFFCYEYVSKFKKTEIDNIFIMADKLGMGYNKNEIFFINKSSKNKGFFEKFFNYFN